jgi:hypothetical protein
VRGLVVAFLFSWLGAGCALVDAAGHSAANDDASVDPADARGFYDASPDAPPDADLPPDASGATRFGLQENFAVPDAIALAIADVDGDGADEIFVSTGGPHLYMLRQGVRTELAVPPMILNAFRIVDVDHDGVMDLVGTHFTEAVLIRNIATGGQAQDAVYVGGEGQFDVGDLNRDGLEDVAAPSADGIGIRVLFAQQTSPVSYSNFAAPLIPLASQVTRVKVIDVEGDGDLDIAAWQPGGMPARILVVKQGPGAGQLGTPQTLYALDTDGVDAELLAADLDHDGRRDLLAFTNADDRFHLLANHGTSFATTTFAATTGYFSGLASGDVDHDGLDELVLAEPLSLCVYTQSSAGVIDPGYERLTFNSSAFTTSLLTGDVDGDQAADVVFIRFGGFVTVFHGKP